MATFIKAEGMPRASADRLREFRDDLITQLALAPGATSNWGAEVSITVETDAPRVTFQIPVGTVGYHEFKGDIKYDALWDRQADLKPKIWQAGVEAPVDLVESGDFIGFNQSPQVLAAAAAAAPNKWVRDVLEANPLIDLYRDPDSNTASTINLFHASHLVNVMKPAAGTFDNSALVGVGGFIVANVTAWMTYFGGLKAPNGESLGLEMTHILVPRAQYLAAKNFFASDFVLKTVRNVAGSENVAAGQEQNPYKGAVTVLVADELTSTTVVYPLALNKPGLRPFGLMRSSSPEINVLDRSSAKFETTRKVGINSFLKGSAGALLPHGIAKVTIS